MRRYGGAALCGHPAARDLWFRRRGQAAVHIIWLTLKRPRFFSTDSLCAKASFYISGKSWICLEVYLRRTLTMAALHRCPATRL